MGLFDSKSSIIGAALGVSGAFDKSRKTDKAAAFGAALGASIGSGQKWTMADSLRLGAAISVRRRIEIGVNCILNSRLLPTQLCSHTDNCTVQEGKLQLLVALF